jgi:competence protein ComEC
LVVSGASVPALRAFVMAGVAFGAILLDRPAISMRGLALAALIVTCLFPESVLEPGFQMSFAATMALVALFEMLKRAPHEVALPVPGPLIGALQWTSRGIGGVIGVSLVAGLATDPFAIYHFQRFSLYALAANLAVAPIMSFLVAPAAGLAAVLAPFGLADGPLQVMASALDLVAAIGEAFGARPEAVRALPKPPDLAFLLCVGGLLWACLWRGLLRWGGAAFLAGAVGVYLAAPQPVAAFDGELRAVFLRTGQSDAPEWALLARPGRSSYARERLGAMLGLAPAESARLAPPDACDDARCAWASPAGRRFVFVREAESAPCMPGAIVLSGAAAMDDYARRCAPAALIDAPDLAAQGGGLIYEDRAGLRIERAYSRRVRRPWTPLTQASAAQE